MNDPPLSRAERDHKKRKEAAAHVAAIRATEAAQKDTAARAAAWLAYQANLEADADVRRALGRMVERFRTWAWREFRTEMPATPRACVVPPIGPACRSLSAGRVAT